MLKRPTMSPGMSVINDQMDNERAKKIFEELKKVLGQKQVYAGAKNPCLICNPDTAKDLQTMFRNGNNRAADLIVVCEDCKRGVMAFREIAL